MSMLFANSTCLIRSGPYACGWRIFQKTPCEGWTAPSASAAGERVPAKAKGFTRPTPLAEALNHLAVPRTDLEPRWKIGADMYDNLPRPR
jgi:hypothetical protein